MKIGLMGYKGGSDSKCNYKDYVKIGVLGSLNVLVRVVGCFII